MTTREAADARRLPLLLDLQRAEGDGPDRLLAAADQPGAGRLRADRRSCKTADPGVDLTQRDVTTCNNPTFVAGHPTSNYLAEIAPLPPACDKAGAGPCTSDAATETEHVRDERQRSGSGTGSRAGAARRHR